MPGSDLPARQQQRADRVRAWTRLLDSSIRIPGTQRTFGLDPILGLVPWAGDAVGALLSAVLIWQSARLGVRWPGLTRMLLNVAVETVVGVVPVVGDLFDAGWKANSRNLALLEAHLADAQAAHAATRRFWLGLAFGVFGSVVGAILLAAWILVWLLGLLGVV